MSTPSSTLPISESNHTTINEDERFAHEVDRWEQLYLVLFIFWLVPMVIWHALCFIAKKVSPSA